MLAQQCIIYETSRAMARLSVVTTLYQSETYIDEFYARTLSTLSRITNDYEIIFVNDGSTDNSLNRAVRIIDRDDKVSVIELSRNFGHHQAMLAGLEQASGDYIWLIDSDLEESPEWLSEFYDEIIADNRLDVIYGVQRKRKGDFFEAFAGTMQYNLLDLLLPFKYPRDATTSRLMSYDYVKALTKYTECSAPILGLMTLAGFNQKIKYVNKISRSPSTYSFIAKLRMVGRTITSFSSWPLFAVFYVGILCMAIGIVGIFLIFINALSYGSAPGWTSIMTSIWLLGGLNLSAIGIVGIYLQKVYIQTKNRPRFIIRHIHQRN